MPAEAKEMTSDSEWNQESVHQKERDSRGKELQIHIYFSNQKLLELEKVINTVQCCVM